MPIVTLCGMGIATLARKKPTQRNRATAEKQINWQALIYHLVGQMWRWGFGWIPEDERAGIAGLACALANASFNPDRCKPEAKAAWLWRVSKLRVHDTLKTWLSEHNRNSAAHYEEYNEWTPLDGLLWYDPEPDEKPAWWNSLSRDDQQIVTLRLQGMTDREVGREMNTPQATVCYHRTKIGELVKRWKR